MLKRSMVLMAVMALLTVFAGPASAGAPVIFEDEVYEWDGEWSGFWSGECGFDVYESGYEKVVAKGFFDRHGVELLRVGVHIQGQNMMYTDAGTSAFDRYAFHITEDPVAETSTFNGNVWNVHAPGAGGGVLVNDSGLMTFTWEDVVVRVAGPKDSFEDGWTQGVCDALFS
jgi:hypothetical protein